MMRVLTLQVKVLYLLCGFSTSVSSVWGSLVAGQIYQRQLLIITITGAARAGVHCPPLARLCRTSRARGTKAVGLGCLCTALPLPYNVQLSGELSPDTAPWNLL